MGSNPLINLYMLLCAPFLYFFGTHGMSRPQRIIYRNAYYHVMNRVADCRAIFNDGVDREIFFQTLAEACHQFCIEVHAKPILVGQCDILMVCTHNDIID